MLFFFLGGRSISGKSNYPRREPLIGWDGLADWEPLRRAHTMDPRHGSQASHQQLNSATAGEPADVSGGGHPYRA